MTAVATSVRPKPPVWFRPNTKTETQNLAVQQLSQWPQTMTTAVIPALHNSYYWGIDFGGHFFKVISLEKISLV